MTEADLTEIVTQHKRARRTCYFSESLRRIAIEMEEMYGGDVAMPAFELQMKMEQLYRQQEAALRQTLEAK